MPWFPWRPIHPLVRRVLDRRCQENLDVPRVVVHGYYRDEGLLHRGTFNLERRLALHAAGEMIQSGTFHEVSIPEWDILLRASGPPPARYPVGAGG